MADQLTVQIEFCDADATQPDPVRVAALADAALATLRAQGFVPQPVYTGAMGGDLYEVVRQLAEGAAANKDVVLALITGVAAPIAGALAARLGQRAAAKPAAPAPAAVVVIVEGVQVAVREPEITPDELLQRLLATDPALASKVSPATRAVVRVYTKADSR
ncbi:hypothetical protein [Candidatus Viridilinea mediisalina]|uniref:Uncharacterized protein n=1 Tax=Candidatus Viridilinea mediisalina TaxID=2024553 RepID=A0A2A6RKK8_9CHLR|nr:hypothetical protein [Candidatus Viridilinea mediisalina]PDW03441.1 hypothetical protein CJ255_08920 [Candidatus Viridilinea mediisalina]